MTSGDVQLDTATIIATSLEGILYGFSVLMFIGTIWTLTYKHSMQDINHPITAVAILLFMLSTAHMVVDIIRIEDGLVTYRDTFPGGPVAFFADISQKTYVAKVALYVCQTLLGDGVVIYCCYVVWQSIWVIILPSMLWCSCAVTGSFAVSHVAQATSNAGNVYAKDTAQWITPFFASTLTTNLMSSGLLAYHIWMMEHNVSAIRATKSTMMPILHVLMDAAILYSVVLLTTLICFARSSNAHFIMLDTVMPVISIAFYMVFIRVTITKTEQAMSRQYHMNPLQVHISRITNKDGTSAYGVASHNQSSTCKAESVSCDV
ncbi:hypothetical protein EDB19DRAFT_1984103 [Suillus lakei]|nr:hypothetical protein EDB19DRAFT_1984103 [Suillus lakei]